MGFIVSKVYSTSGGAECCRRADYQNGRSGGDKNITRERISLFQLINYICRKDDKSNYGYF
jgi:hypothetical protein